MGRRHYRPTAEEKIQNNKREGLRRYLIINIFYGLVLLIIFVRLIFIVYVEGDKWRGLIDDQIITNIHIEGNRGAIYSSDHELMAITAPMFYLGIDFKSDAMIKDNYKTFHHHLDSLALQMSQYFGDRTKEQYKAHIKNGLKKKSRGYRLTSKRLTYLDLQNVKQFRYFQLPKSMHGMTTEERSTRLKPFGSLASRTIGDIYGADNRGGKNGLELQYDSLLRGKAGEGYKQKMGRNFIVRPIVEPEDGMDIITTLDLKMQDVVEKALVDELRHVHADRGSAVLMEVSTGEIKAIANMSLLHDSTYAETQNFAVNDMSEPGSTIKVPSIMVALEEGVVTPDDTVDVGIGLYMYKGGAMKDHNYGKGGYGRISVAQSVWYSSNIGVAKTILRRFEDRPEVFIEGMKRMGVDYPINVEIPGAANPHIKSPSDKSWSRLTLPWTSFGYESRIPPISMLNFYNAIANDGTMVRPHFTKCIMKDEEVIEEFDTEVLIEQICSEKTLTQIRQMLRGVVTDGTARNVDSPVVPIAGKTGTAVLTHGGTRSHQLTFCGYFPADDPIYSCIVVVRHPRGVYPSAGAISGKVFRNIAERIMSTEERYSLDQLELDSALTLTPRVKGGYEPDIVALLDELDIAYDARHDDAQWVKTDRKGDTIELSSLTLIDNLAPSVAGMGAKDATYLLEHIGLHVKIVGSGRVYRQSIRPGARIKKGQTITLTLR